MVRSGVLLADGQSGEEFLEALREVLPPWAKRVVNTIPLSVNVENGTPYVLVAALNWATTMSPVTG